MKKILYLFLISCFIPIIVIADVDTMDGTTITTTSDIDGFTSNISKIDGQTVVSGDADPCDGTSSFCVDPDASGSGDGSSWVNAYTSLDAALDTEAADISGVSGGYTFYCRSSSGADDTTVALIDSNDGWVTDADSPIKITQDDFPSDGVFDNTKYNLIVTGNALTSNVSHIIISKIQIAGDQSSYDVGILIDDGDDILIEKVIIKASGGGNTGSSGFTSDDTVTNLIIKNNIIEGYSGTISYGMYLRGEDSGTVKIYANTVSGCNVGIRIGYAEGDAYNNAVFNNTDDFYGTFDNIDYNALDDDGTGGANAVDLNENASSEWTDAFTDYTSSDFSIKDTDSLLYDAATDLSGSGVTDDIIDTTRSTWDIGAFEYVP